MKIQQYVCGVFILLGVCFLTSCYSYDTETRSENEAEIDISIAEDLTNEEQDEMNLSEGDLYTMFEEVNNERILKFAYDDYNKDGIHEAFVITNVQEVYKLWYMSPSECEIVCDEIEAVDVLGTDIITFSTKDYLLLQRTVNDARNTLVYSVDNKNCVIQPEISDVGYIHQDEAGALFLEVPDTIQKNTELIQYTTYYLYYVYDDGFKEYGAIPIGLEQFMEFQGSQDVLERIYETYGEEVQVDFLYRANGFINVNIMVLQEEKVIYRNIVLRYDDERVSYVSDEIAHGKVETAYMLNITTFPTAFKRPQNNNDR